MVIGLLVAVAICLFALARIVGSHTQERQVLTEVDYAKNVADRLNPPSQEAVAGQDNSALAIKAPSAAAAGSAEALPKNGTELFEQTWRQVGPSDLATLIYTSGTTGQPKAVMLTHHSLRYFQLALNRVLPFEEQCDDDGNARVVSYLPMAHVTGRSVDNWGAMARPITLSVSNSFSPVSEPS